MKYQIFYYQIVTFGCLLLNELQDDAILLVLKSFLWKCGRIVAYAACIS